MTSMHGQGARGMAATAQQHRPPLATAGLRAGSRARINSYAGSRAGCRAVTKDVGTNGIHSEDEEASLDFVELTDIIRMVNESDIVELELKHKGFNLAVRKKEAIEEVVPAQQVMAPSPMAPAAVSQFPLPPPVPVSQDTSAAAAAPVDERPATEGVSRTASESDAVDGIEVTSPMAGTFYCSPAPGEPQFVKEGDKVTKGQTLCIIEAMKLMNEVEAEVSGEVVQVCVPSSTLVVPGQTLMIIK